MEQAQFERYRMGLRKFISLIGREHPQANAVLVLQYRLNENLAQTLDQGVSPALYAGRLRILESCHRLSQEILQTSFYELCGLSRPTGNPASDADAVARDRQQQVLMDEYFVKVQQLLDEKGLRTAEASSEVRDTARLISLEVMRRLRGDCMRKGQVVQFLYEAGLITEGPGVIFLSDADISEAYLEDAALIEAHMAGSSLRKAHLARAHLEWARLGETDLSEADLTGAHLVAAHFAGAKLTNAQLVGAHLIGANLAGANLVGANLQEAHLEWAFLVTANLEGANLRNAQLCGAELMWARLPRADLAGADLCGANLEQAHLVWVRLKGATYDDRTRWPLGFDPVAAQAVLVDSR